MTFVRRTAFLLVLATRAGADATVPASRAARERAWLERCAKRFERARAEARGASPRLAGGTITVEPDGIYYLRAATGPSLCPAASLSWSGGIAHDQACWAASGWELDAGQGTIGRQHRGWSARIVAPSRTTTSTMHGQEPSVTPVVEAFRRAIDECLAEPGAPVGMCPATAWRDRSSACRAAPVLESESRCATEDLSPILALPRDQALHLLRALTGSQRGSARILAVCGLARLDGDGAWRLVEQLSFDGGRTGCADSGSVGEEARKVLRHRRRR